MINALTFDVEEYFHAEVFSGVVAPEEWPRLESRVVQATQRILDVLAEGRTTAATFPMSRFALCGACGAQTMLRPKVSSSSSKTPRWSRSRSRQAALRSSSQDV